MNSVRKYNTTVQGVMQWANSELEHVGRIAAVEDPDIQYAYAMSTVYGMLFLRDALYELISDIRYAVHNEDLQRTHNSVIRVIKKLIKDYDVKLEAIEAFNTRHVLRSLNSIKANTGQAAAPAPAPAQNVKTPMSVPVSIAPSPAPAAMSGPKPTTITGLLGAASSPKNVPRFVPIVPKKSGLFGLGFAGL